MRRGALRAANVEPKRKPDKTVQFHFGRRVSGEKVADAAERVTKNGHNSAGTQSSSIPFPGFLGSYKTHKKGC
ncbi:unnamed protein product [Nippostrongylus brasiliensis]|uniref:Uncharacterized protein n=1 Tax=Nippostrongylus brasiliensis TaxID=27835 RepID=A0A0N4YN58_NIPBR|nr:unnamed protein product [Nippostrongylus brasiliensis]